MIAGDIQIGLDAIAAVKGHFDAGTLRPLAVISAKRTALLPNVPGMLESGVTNVDIGSFSGVAAPARTPPAVIERLNRELNAVLPEPETRDASSSRRATRSRAARREDFQRLLAAEVSQWSEVVRAAKITFE